MKKWVLVTAGIFWSVSCYSEESNVEETFDKVSVSNFALMSKGSNFFLPVPHVSMQIGGKTITSFINFSLPDQLEKLDKKFVEILENTYSDLSIKYDFKVKEQEMKRFEMPVNLNRVRLYDKKIEDIIVNDGESWSRTIHWSN